MSSPSKVYLADNLEVLSKLPDESIDLVYIDPPFNTGKKRTRQNAKMRKVEKDGERQGFGGDQYVIDGLGDLLSYEDSFEERAYLSFLRMRLAQIHRVLKASGSLYLHLDYREVHYARFIGDQIFGRENFLNEIIWAYDYGAKAKNRWPAKHDNILLWAKQNGTHIFNVDDIDRVPYMAPGMVSKEKAARGKRPTDTWWHTIVSPTGKEKTGYPTQKPLPMLERIIRASSPVGGRILDCFAGSGTTGEAALRLGREFILVDNNSDAARVMKKRFTPYREAGHDIRFLRPTKKE